MSKEEKVSVPITLKDYVAVLKQAACGELNHIQDLKGKTRRIASELKHEELISDGFVPVGSRGLVTEMVITPSGALALAKWESYLKESSYSHRILNIVGRFFWLVVGAILASAKDIIQFFLNIGTPSVPP